MPLIPKSSAPIPAQPLNPVFIIDGQELVMGTQFMAAVPERELRSAIGYLADQRDEIISALAMLFFGF